MGEKVIVRQKSNYDTEILGPDPNDPESQKLHSVRNIYDLTPYGMLLASLGSCTAVLLNSYAQNHGLDLHKVELTLGYERNFKKDCQNCEETEQYEEEINQEISFIGNLTGKEREKLFLISHHCPIHKMLKRGIKVNTQPAKDSEREEKKSTLNNHV
jgi:uncharacterized OsmC-like protein